MNSCCSSRVGVADESAVVEVSLIIGDKLDAIVPRAVDEKSEMLPDAADFGFSRVAMSKWSVLFIVLNTKFEVYSFDRGSRINLSYVDNNIVMEVAKIS